MSGRYGTDGCLAVAWNSWQRSERALVETGYSSYIDAVTDDEGRGLRCQGSAARDQSPGQSTLAGLRYRSATHRDGHRRSSRPEQNRGHCVWPCCLGHSPSFQQRLWAWTAASPRAGPCDQFMPCRQAWIKRHRKPGSKLWLRALGHLVIGPALPAEPRQAVALGRCSRQKRSSLSQPFRRVGEQAS